MTFTSALNSWLDYHRATLLSKLNGLIEEQAAKRMVAPTPRRTASSGT
jgi:hypothetical protein